MSTDFRFAKKVSFRKFQDEVSKRLKNLKIVPPEPDDSPDTHICITDGKNYLHAYTGDGTNTYLVRYGLNNVFPMLADLQAVFGRIISEHGEDCSDIGEIGMDL